MKKLYALVIIILLIAVACSNKDKKNNEVDDKKILIGIAKYIRHPALDVIEQGIQDELKALGYTNIDYDIQSANGELSTATAIAYKFKSSKVDIAIGIATPTALTLANQIRDIPVVFSGVTDPVDAGLRTTLAPTDTNIIGVSDMPPIKQQVELILEMMPNKVKRIGHVYTTNEANSISQLKLLKEICDELGIEVVVSAVNYTAEVKQATDVVAPKVDIIYVSLDNTVVAALASLTDSAFRNGVPVFSSDPHSAENSNVTVAYGIDNYKTGVATGRLVAKLLEGEKPSSLSVKLMDQPEDLSFYVNDELARHFNLKIPHYLK